MLKNQKGLSLVEIIVVVAVFALLAVFVLPSTGILSEHYVKNAVDNTEASLAKCKILSMNRDGYVLLEIRAEEDGIYAVLYQKDAEPQTKKIANRRVSMQVAYSSSILTLGGFDSSTGDTAQQAQAVKAGDAPIYIAFRRSSGAMMDMQAAAKQMGRSAKALYPHELIFTCSGSSRQIELYPMVGTYTTGD